MTGPEPRILNDTSPPSAPRYVVHLGTERGHVHDIPLLAATTFIRPGTASTPTSPNEPRARKHEL